MKIIIHTDGGARGNPGPAAAGVVIEKAAGSDEAMNGRREIITEFGERIGETTNNVAEYTAVIKALEKIKSLRLENPSAFVKSFKDRKIKTKTENLEINFYLDSTLVVNQINGIFKVKDPDLRNLLLKVRQLEQETGGVVTYSFIPRELNARADFLVNKALDRF